MHPLSLSLAGVSLAFPDEERAPSLRFKVKLKLLCIFTVKCYFRLEETNATFSPFCATGAISLEGCQIVKRLQSAASRGV